MPHNPQLRQSDPCEKRGKTNFLLQLTNGSYGLPTEAAEKHGHYSAYISSGYVGHAGGALLVNVTLDAINKLFE